MADLVVNIDLSSGVSKKKVEQGNQRHKQFLKRRKYLEKRGFLKQKQLPQKLPGNRKAEQPTKSWDQQNGQTANSKGGHDRTGRPNNNLFYRQGAPHTSSRTVTVGAPHQPGNLSVSINCTAASKGRSPPSTDGAQKSAKPFVTPHNLLSEYECGLPSVAPTPSYKVVAIDCEMVGTGEKGRDSALARCSIVNYHGDVVYDKYVKPGRPVTDYRTRWSGICSEHLVKATPFEEARKEVLKLLNGKMVVGHAIQNDYKALGYFHPKEMTRDTSKMSLLNLKAGFAEREVASLKRLAKQILHKDIQVGKCGHSSVEDAKTTMELYRAVEVEYERQLASGTANK